MIIKKILKRTLITLIVILVTIFLIYGNLKSNSVYYVKNMKDVKNDDLQLAMLIDNLYWVYTPEIEGIKYDEKRGKNIYNSLNEFQRLSDRTKENEKNIYIYVDKEGNYYKFNYKFELIYAKKKGGAGAEMDVKTIDQKALKKEMYELVQPVLDKQRGPTINLQWLFNYLYEDDFK